MVMMVEWLLMCLVQMLGLMGHRWLWGLLWHWLGRRKVMRNRGFHYVLLSCWMNLVHWLLRLRGHGCSIRDWSCSWPVMLLRLLVLIKLLMLLLLLLLVQLLLVLQLVLLLLLISSRRFARAPLATAFASERLRRRRSRRGWH